MPISKKEKAKISIFEGELRPLQNRKEWGVKGGKSRKKTVCGRTKLIYSQKKRRFVGGARKGNLKGEKERRKYQAASKNEGRTKQLFVKPIKDHASLVVRRLTLALQGRQKKKTGLDEVAI